LKQIHLENDKREHVPSFEIKCPYCGNKLHVEEYLTKICPSVFCHYCGQKVGFSP